MALLDVSEKEPVVDNRFHNSHHGSLKALALMEMEESALAVVLLW
jgi:hypothetical protein